MQFSATVCVCYDRGVFLFSCKKKEPLTLPKEEAAEPRLVIKFKFDSTQARLDNFGQNSTMAIGRSAQSPIFRKLSTYYIALSENDTTALGGGQISYRDHETTEGGASSITFDSSVVVGEGEEFFSVSLSQLSAGSYNWLRVSLFYQNYDI